MSKHVSYRGVTIDMDSFRRENEKTTALGNMKVNARGDLIDRGQIVKTVDQISRENHDVKPTIIRGSLKGPEPKSSDPVLENPKPVVEKKEPKVKKTKQVELPSGDIIVQEDDSEG